MFVRRFDMIAYEQNPPFLNYAAIFGSYITDVDVGQRHSQLSLAAWQKHCQGIMVNYLNLEVFDGLYVVYKYP